MINKYLKQSKALFKSQDTIFYVSKDVSRFYHEIVTYGRLRVKVFQKNRQFFTKSFETIKYYEVFSENHQ